MRQRRQRGDNQQKVKQREVHSERQRAKAELTSCDPSVLGVRRPLIHPSKCFPTRRRAGRTRDQSRWMHAGWQGFHWVQRIKCEGLAGPSHRSRVGSGMARSSQSSCPSQAEQKSKVESAVELGGDGPPPHVGPWTHQGHCQDSWCLNQPPRNLPHAFPSCFHSEPSCMSCDSHCNVWLAYPRS